MTRLFYVIFLPLFLLLGVLYGLWVDNQIAHTPRVTHRCRLEALLKEFVYQTGMMERATSDVDYDEAAIRAWVTLQAMRKTYSKMSPVELDEFYGYSEILPSPQNKISRYSLYGSFIRRSHVRKDFAHWIDTAGIGSDGLTASPLYESASGIQIEEEQRIKLSQRGLVDTCQPDR